MSVAVLSTDLLSCKILSPYLMFVFCFLQGIKSMISEADRRGIRIAFCEVKVSSVLNAGVKAKVLVVSSSNKVVTSVGKWGFNPHQL